MLASAGEEASVLAGGQSLVPLMNFRVAQPAHLVDINYVDELDYIRLDDGWLAIGARTRQAAVERSEEVARAAPLITEALGQVAHPPGAPPRHGRRERRPRRPGRRAARGRPRARRRDRAPRARRRTPRPGARVLHRRAHDGQGGRASSSPRCASPPRRRRRPRDRRVQPPPRRLRGRGRGGLRRRRSRCSASPTRRSARRRPSACSPPTAARAPATSPPRRPTGCSPNEDVHGGGAYRRRVARACVERALARARGGAS